MSREELMKATKDTLVTMLLRSKDENENYRNVIEDLRKELASKNVDEYLHKNYLDMKKQLEIEQEQNSRNEFTIRELQQLLDRYKHIVDRLGGETIYRLGGETI